MGILVIAINHAAAVFVVSGNIEAFFLQQLDRQFFSHCAQIAGIDHIIISRLTACILKMLPYRICRCRGHGRSESIGIFQPQIDYLADRRRCHPRACPDCGENSSPRTGHRPLSYHRPLDAKFRREAVLTLSRIIMAGHSDSDLVSKTSVHQSRPDQETLSHGGTGAVEAKERPTQTAHRKMGGHELIEKISGQNDINILQSRAVLFHRFGNGPFQHG